MYGRRVGSCCRTELLQGCFPPLSRRKASSQHVNQEGKCYLKRILLKLICIFLGTRRSSTTTRDFGEGRSISGSEEGMPFVWPCDIVNLLQLLDWYQISKQQVVNAGGGPELFARHSSMPTLLKALYRDHPWQASRFVDYNRVPMGYWNDERNRRAALEKIGQTLGVKEVCIPSLQNHQRT